MLKFAVLVTALLFALTSTVFPKPVDEDSVADIVNDPDPDIENVAPSVETPPNVTTTTLSEVASPTNVTTLPLDPAPTVIIPAKTRPVNSTVDSTVDRRFETVKKVQPAQSPVHKSILTFLGL
ncbi:unnamed protein product [Allacma fusca]|uniref:Uncharacterized protein n=1 Tax=Allacma fusca TaxID=39272 RepID=A0A8J2J7K4_9HEXA|nr:unnamed protein product [Allacma fusca]